MKKKFFLSLFFAFYQIFAPFVVLNCASSDLPYQVEAEASNPANSEDALAQCQAMRFLTQDCVEIIQAEEERLAESEEAIAEAYDAIPDFISCYSYVQATETDNDTSSVAATESAVDCPEVIERMRTGFEACTALSESEREFDCDQIVLKVTDATTLCTAADQSVTADFCDELS